ncbi:EpsG family protein [Bacteroides xylanisolvens]|uniref:EpsG family protein n=1 Tax=Bacteroides xylanisolvens TaxID=371601 RepID=UPI003977D981
MVSKEEKSIYERNYWLYAIIPIIAFSLIEGLRYARGVDYIGYVYTYLQSLDPKVENEPLFMLLNKGMLLMDFPYCIAFVVYSLFWIIGILHLCKKTLSKILCKWKQDSAVSLFLYLDSVFKNKHKLIHNQAPVMNRLCPFLLNLHK